MYQIGQVALSSMITICLASQKRNLVLSPLASTDVNSCKSNPPFSGFSFHSTNSIYVDNCMQVQYLYAVVDINTVQESKEW